MWYPLNVYNYGQSTAAQGIKAIQYARSVIMVQAEWDEFIILTYRNLEYIDIIYNHLPDFSKAYINATEYSL